jgi:hypothetical protein
VSQSKGSLHSSDEQVYYIALQKLIAGVAVMARSISIVEYKVEQARFFLEQIE